MTRMRGHSHQATRWTKATPRPEPRGFRFADSGCSDGMGHAGNCQLGRTHNSDVFARRFEPASTPALTAERRPHARVAPRLVTIGCGGYDARCISRPDPTGTPGTGFRPTRGALRGAPDGARRRDARRASGGTAGTAREAGSAARAAGCRVVDSAVLLGARRSQIITKRNTEADSDTPCSVQRTVP